MAVSESLLLSSSVDDRVGDERAQNQILSVLQLLM